MQYRQLGQSGLYLSTLTMGTLTFGGSNGFEKVGNVDARTARRFLEIALEAGVNCVDTADLYSKGEAESVLGEALGDLRQKVILMTKARSPMSDDPNDSGATRHHLIKSCENSLRRLKTDHIDILQIHNWDGVTPVEETLYALESLVQSGKIRYWGTSNYSGWQMMKTLGKAEQLGLSKPTSQQIYYTPESREAEFELLPLALDQNVGTLIWGPMGEGLLTGTVRRGEKTSADSRQGNGWTEPYVHNMDHAYDVIETLAQVGEELGVSPARVCLAWLLTRPGITSLIVGSRTEAHLRDNLAAAELQLSDEQRTRIEKATRPAPRYPYWHRYTAGMDRLDPAEEVFLREYFDTLENRRDLKIK
ncbi:MAG: aldo/keto reductase [Mixta calida]|uniref:Aldo/keto reductase n=1 Tax=Mixta calida TaxID=665913 RepID=A0ABM6RZG0_9GAMM|nr:aldo/keto reductase [Mixta calida]AIX74334.1 aldo/keto reductase [Pantoea sp. PSNIH2]MBS6056732.1 aldo/keto reductase [Pantoea sp.]POU51738.1 aldo/keto reductase [Pantoea sp. PSNIH5]POU69533.1 aldo/keto reductase [Pantoea sp. PSNIH4]POY69297.1 aldo/keto reductase [Pantoea sp. PSNIH3]